MLTTMGVRSLTVSRPYDLTIFSSSVYTELASVVTRSFNALMLPPPPPPPLLPPPPPPLALLVAVRVDDEDVKWFSSWSDGDAPPASPVVKRSMESYFWLRLESDADDVMSDVRDLLSDVDLASRGGVPLSPRPAPPLASSLPFMIDVACCCCVCCCCCS